MDVESLEPESSELEALRCKVCLGDLGRHSLVLCKDCSAPHHRTCWAYNKGCGAPGCDCRVFVHPPMTATEDGTPTLHFSHGMSTDDGAWGLWALLLLGTAFFLPDPRWIVGLVLAGILPLLIEVRHSLNLETECIELRRRLGPLVFWRRLHYLSFADVEELEVRSSRLPPSANHRRRGLFEIWVRDRQGAARLLGKEPAGDREATERKLRRAAELMNTVVSLPPGRPEESKLPPGLEERLRLLPKEK